MITELDLVIFDMDGLMFDTERISVESWRRALSVYGLTLTWDIFLETLGANRDRTKMILCKHFGDDILFDQIVSLRNEISMKIIDDEGIPLKNGLLEILSYLHSKKIRMAVATSANRVRANEFLNKAGVMEYFECIVCGDEVRQSKPDPEIFIKVVERLGCRATHSVVLEDSEAGIEAAYRGGMYPIMIPDIILPSVEIEAKAYKILNDLSEVIAIL